MAVISDDVTVVLAHIASRRAAAEINYRTRYRASESQLWRNETTTGNGKVITLTLMKEDAVQRGFQRRTRKYADRISRRHARGEDEGERGRERWRDNGRVAAGIKIVDPHENEPRTRVATVIRSITTFARAPLRSHCTRFASPRG